MSLDAGRKAARGVAMDARAAGLDEKCGGPAHPWTGDPRRSRSHPCLCTEAKIRAQSASIIEGASSRGNSVRFKADGVYPNPEGAVNPSEEAD